MKSMTIHNIDDNLMEVLSSLARRNGKSINATIKQLLADTLGLQTESGPDNTARGYRRFLNLWTAEEAAAFEQSIEDLSRVDESDWL